MNAQKYEIMFIGTCAHLKTLPSFLPLQHEARTTTTQGASDAMHMAPYKLTNIIIKARTRDARCNHLFVNKQAFSDFFSYIFFI